MGKGKDGSRKKYVVGISVVVLLIVTIALVAVGFKKLEPNQIGLDYSSNSLTINTNKLWKSGLHFLGVGHDFIIYPKKILEVDMRDDANLIVARTKDGLVINLKARLLYKIIPTKERLAALYLMFKEDYPVAYRAISRGTIRDVASTFTAFEFWQIRDNITNTMMEELGYKLDGYHATVDSFLLVDFDLPAEFNEALAETDVWQQEQSKVVFELEAAEKDIESMLITVNQTVARIALDADREANTTLLEYEAQEQKIQTAVDAEIAAYSLMKSELNMTSEQLINLVWLEALKASGSGARKTIHLTQPASLYL